MKKQTHKKNKPKNRQLSKSILRMRTFFLDLYLSRMITTVSCQVWKAYTYLTSGRSSPLNGPCRWCWWAERPSPTRLERIASCATPGWVFAECRRRSWSSRQHDGAGSRSRSPCWCCTLVFSPYCSPEDSGGGGEQMESREKYVSTILLLSF